MSMGVLPASISVYYVHAVPKEARRGRLILWNCSYSVVMGHVSAWNPGLLGEQPVCLTAETPPLPWY